MKGYYLKSSASALHGTGPVVDRRRTAKSDVDAKQDTEPKLSMVEMHRRRTVTKGDTALQGFFFGFAGPLVLHALLF